MLNYQQKGESLTVPAPAAVKSGDPVQIGAIFGVAAKDADSGADVAISVAGVFVLACPTADEIELGDVLFFDATAGKVTLDDDTGNRDRIGVAIEDAGAGVTSVAVRLDG